MNKIHNIGFINKRNEPLDSLDDFPTPPWVTRALMEMIKKRNIFTDNCSVLEPAANRGYISNTLREYDDFQSMTCSDIFDYGLKGCEKVDFLSNHYASNSYDWVITNPPFNHAESFILRAFDVSRKGLAIFSRSNLLEGQSRYNNIYKDKRPSYHFQFSERVSLFKGRVSKKTASATAFSWFVWSFDNVSCETITDWIPPCKLRLEKESDYDERIKNVR